MATELEKAAGLIARAKHVAVLTGAGISAESGLPTFRGAGGWWRGLDPTSLATPQAFARDPRLVWAFYNDRRAMLALARPNAGHRALVELARLVGRFTLITQNVDRLHQAAGSADVIELHGNLDEVYCINCFKTRDRRGVKLDVLPTCDACHGLVRPAVVWFGEALAPEVLSRATSASREADVVIVIGTSAIVYPAAGLSSLAKERGGAVVEVNIERSGADVDVGLYGWAGEVLPRLVAAVADRLQLGPEPCR